MDIGMVSMDSVGRVLIPKKARNAFKSRRFLVQVEEDEIRLKPVKSWDDLFGSLKGLDRRKLERMRREDAEHDEALAGHVRAVRTGRRNR